MTYGVTRKPPLANTAKPRAISSGVTWPVPSASVRFGRQRLGTEAERADVAQRGPDAAWRAAGGSRPGCASAPAPRAAASARRTLVDVLRPPFLGACAARQHDRRVVDQARRREAALERRGVDERLEGRARLAPRLHRAVVLARRRSRSRRPARRSRRRAARARPARPRRPAAARGGGGRPAAARGRPPGRARAPRAPVFGAGPSRSSGSAARAQRHVVPVELDGDAVAPAHDRAALARPTRRAPATRPPRSGYSRSAAASAAASSSTAASSWASGPAVAVPPVVLEHRAARRRIGRGLQPAVDRGRDPVALGQRRVAVARTISRRAISATYGASSSTIGPWMRATIGTAAAASRSACVILPVSTMRRST